MDGYREYIAGCPVHWRDIMIYVEGYHDSCGDTMIHLGGHHNSFGGGGGGYLE